MGIALYFGLVGGALATAVVLTTVLRTIRLI